MLLAGRRREEEEVPHSEKAVVGKWLGVSVMASHSQKERNGTTDGFSRGKLQRSEESPQVKFFCYSGSYVP